MSHTKEPWSINEWPQPDTSIAIGAVGTPLIARVILRDVSINGQKANARRIVASVNACAGLPIEAIEGANFIDQERRLEEALQQRDTAWAELREIRDAIGANQEEATADEVRRILASRDKLLAAIKVLKRDVEAVRPSLGDGIELEPALLQARQAIDEAEA